MTEPWIEVLDTPNATSNKRGNSVEEFRTWVVAFVSLSVSISPAGTTESQRPLELG